MSRDHRAFARELQADAVCLDTMAGSLEIRAGEERVLGRECFAGELDRDARTMRGLALELRRRSREEDRVADLVGEAAAIAVEAEKGLVFRDVLRDTPQHGGYLPLQQDDSDTGFRGLTYTGPSHAPIAGFV